MKIKINGVFQTIETGKKALFLSELIKELGHNPRLVVVEFNGTILPPQIWGKQRVEDEDSLEIVTIVGGGS
tara:strand:+ start:702 stop:914 length:213 start_codon:yes stop_codon:yes gene_type:complete